MRFIADFHVHSRYSIATSSSLTPENLELWARRKGTQVIGTGDVFHPGWYDDLKAKLIPAEDGLFRLKDEYRIEKDQLPPSAAQPVRFILSGEIISIYKKRGKTRKVHNLILSSSFDTVKKIQAKLETLGNIRSDGRPILGISSRDLLEICLEAGSDSVLIPAHIWTPWFSVLGAQSGYDTIEECFDDLTGQIFAVETGLSSDPPMNWLCSFLDGYTLVSNSDAHSPERLGREANLFDAEISYSSMIAAMKGDSLHKFLGTIEFFPQEGKYHLDGHRKCGICWTPQETAKHKGICPVCGRKVTVGVLNRVMQLADRLDPELRHQKRPFYSLTPLKNLLGEIKGSGASSKGVNEHYEYLLKRGGPEFAILLDLSFEQIKEIGDEVLVEGVRRIRNREVSIEEGYDGKFGQVKVFRSGEIQSLSSQISFLDKPYEKPDRRGIGPEDVPIQIHQKRETVAPKERVGRFDETAYGLTMNPVQKEAVNYYTGPCLILAGPGTGKTLTLTMRITRLITYWGVDPAAILAITFTNKAAEEMKKRIRCAFDDERIAKEITITTFHSFGMSLLREHADKFGRSLEFLVFGDDERAYILKSLRGIKNRDLRRVAQEISLAKNRMQVPSWQKGDELADIYTAYEERLRLEDAFDIDDLVVYPVRLLKDSAETAEIARARYPWICIDEYQDINCAQYNLIRLLAPEKDSNIFAIGDPDQAIYGFRGADTTFIQNFKDDYPTGAIYELRTSYRCSKTILEASDQVVRPTGRSDPLQGIEEGVSIHIQECPTPKSEAEFVARTIERLMGGVRFFSLDSQITDGSEESEAVSFSDFGVLFRLSRMAPDIVKAMNDHGIPYQLVGEEPFFKHEPICTIIDILRLIAMPSNHVLLQRLREKRIKGLSESSLSEIKEDGNINRIEEYIKEIIKTYIPDITVSHKDAIERLLSLSKEYGSDLPSFLSLLQLGSGVDTYNAATEQVTLMTIHAAKGLEFSYVFVIGCEDGLLPHTMFKKGGSDIEEERRLLYVAMTRAKRMLFLTYAKRRNLYGNWLNLPISPFLDAIREGLIKRGEFERWKKKPKDKQLPLFS
ncbi:MAG: UvrD-helicase domain-containing protein [Deltaproteobacteria bacterium]|nr:MAG: UvrD-helicase domain-containing protein [Deltaproteobacteria bacterium]